MTRYHFITYASNDEFMRRAKRIATSAVKNGGFDTVKIYTPADIDADFAREHNDILSRPRGAGYWLFKSYILLNRLQSSAVDEGDVVCYCDSSYWWRSDVRILVSKWLSNKHIALVHNKPTDRVFYEHNYTKRDAFELMGINAMNPVERAFVKESPQVWAGFVLLRKEVNPILFVGQWLRFCTDKRIITDEPSTTGPEEARFIENRHDQTVLSLLAKTWRMRFHTMGENVLNFS